MCIINHDGKVRTNFSAYLISGGAVHSEGAGLRAVCPVKVCAVLKAAEIVPVVTSPLDKSKA